MNNVRYVQLDVLSRHFIDDVRVLCETAGRADADDGRPTIVLGMHLCGLLSIRAIELLARLPRVRALVLAPCCLPGARNAANTPPTVFAPKEPSQQVRRATGMPLVLGPAHGSELAQEGLRACRRAWLVPLGLLSGRRPTRLSQAVAIPGEFTLELHPRPRPPLAPHSSALMPHWPSQYDRWCSFLEDELRRATSTTDGQGADDSRAGAAFGSGGRSEDGLWQCQRETEPHMVSEKCTLLSASASNRPTAPTAAAAILMSSAKGTNVQCVGLTETRAQALLPPAK